MVDAHPEPILLSAEPERALATAAAALRAGGVALVPTDTVYGLAALTPAAVEDLFVLKGRPIDRSVAVLVADRPAAESLAESVPAALADLMDRHWPGPLTVVLPRREAPGPRLGGDAGTVGVRCPDHPWLRRLLAAVGPLAVTSANRHATPTPPEAAQVLAALVLAPDAAAPEPGATIAEPGATTSEPGAATSEPGATIAVAVDGGPCSGQASTVVAWRDGTLEVLRPGPLRIETPRHP